MMKPQFLLTLAFIFAAPGFAQAQALKFNNIQALQKAAVANVTCSDTSSKSQLHVTFSVENNKVVSLAMVGVTPALGITTRTFAPENIAELKYMTQRSSVMITGKITSTYFGEDFTVFVSDSITGLYGKVAYTDNDGTDVKRNLKCGAVNYRIPLN